MIVHWEYRTETIGTNGTYLIVRGYFPGDDPYDERAMPGEWGNINALGAEGWELVVVFGFNDSEATAIFKRPRKPQ